MAVLHEVNLAIFDDSFQPTGKFENRNDGPFGIPIPHAEWKKLRHMLVLKIEGPDDAKAAVEDCLKKAAIAGALAAIVGAFATSGLGSAQAFWGAFESAFLACAGKAVTVRMDDHSDWIFWFS